MKNYLVKNGESDLHRLIERESDKLNANEFLNIDAIFETVLNKILLGNFFIKNKLFSTSKQKLHLFILFLV